MLWFIQIFFIFVVTVSIVVFVLQQLFLPYSHKKLNFLVSFSFLILYLNCNDARTFVYFY